MTINLGALIGGVTVAASLLIFLACFLTSDIGPRCCHQLAERCHRYRRRRRSQSADAVSMRYLGPLKGGAAEAATSPCFVQLPAATGKSKHAVIGVNQLFRPVGNGIKSAPNPTRPAPLSSPAPGHWRHRLSPPLPPPQIQSLLQMLPPPTSQQQSRPPVLPVSGAVDSNNNHNNVGLLSKTSAAASSTVQPAATVSRSTPQSLPMLPPAHRRAGLSAMQLSLSTIRDCSASGQIPPDCLYAAPNQLSSSSHTSPAPTPPPKSPRQQQRQMDEDASSAAAAEAETVSAPSPSAATAMSLRVQIGSAYGSLPPVPHAPPMGLEPRHQPLPLRLYFPTQPRSNASSSDCHDWSPPRPRPTTAAGVAPAANVASAAAVWASEDGDVTVFDLETSSRATAARNRGRLNEGCIDSGNGDRSTSF